MLQSHSQNDSVHEVQPPPQQAGKDIRCQGVSASQVSHSSLPAEACFVYEYKTY